MLTIGGQLIRQELLFRRHILEGNVFGLELHVLKATWIRLAHVQPMLKAALHHIVCVGGAHGHRLRADGARRGQVLVGTVRAEST